MRNLLRCELYVCDTATEVILGQSEGPPRFTSNVHINTFWTVLSHQIQYGASYLELQNPEEPEIREVFLRFMFFICRFALEAPRVEKY
jgi:hypothetical protein